MKTCENELPVEIGLLPKEPSSAVTVCWMSGCWFVHVTRAPTATVMVAGVNAKFEM